MVYDALSAAEDMRELVSTPPDPEEDREQDVEDKDDDS